jgi:hypothetical protein
MSFLDCFCGLVAVSLIFIFCEPWVRARLCKLQKRCTRLTAACDKVYQLLAHGRWFSPASSTTKIGRHDIAETVKATNLQICCHTQDRNFSKEVQ